MVAARRRRRRRAVLLLGLATGALAAECPPSGNCPASASGALDLNALRVNASRLWASVEAMAAIGAFEGPDGSRGVRREALTEADVRARKLLDSWAEELGLKREVDGVGNTYYRWPGRKARAGVLAFGSHLDTQPSGGRFDGSYGVLAGLEVMRTILERGISPELSLELVNWCNEEGSRFSPPMMGSGLVTGELAWDAIKATPARGQPGATFMSELLSSNLAGEAPGGPKARDWVAYFEAHIEQGPKLERQGAQVGVVLGGQGQRTFTVEVEGMAGHSGTVPMEERQDALVCASDMVLRAREVGIAVGALVTVGSLEVRPGSFNTIPGSVTFTVDARSEKPLDAVEVGLCELFANASQRRGCEPPRIQRTKARPTIAFNSFLRGQLHRAAATVGVRAPELWSGAGHDACYAQKSVPSAMLFVPCARGISHNPKESATPEDLAKGADVLLNAVLRTGEELPFRNRAVFEFYDRCVTERLGLAYRTCNEGCDVVFLGDSIMERMNGDDVCRVMDRVGRRADQKVFRSTWGSHGRSVILAGRSDETNHTMHQLDFFLPLLQSLPKAPKVYSLLIGTNNVGFNAKTDEKTVEDIKAIVGRLRKAHPSATVLLHALLPRTDVPRHSQRNKEINKHLKAFVESQPEKVEFLDCGYVFTDEAMKRLTDDGLHPNIAGYTEWYKCLKPVLDRLVGPTSAVA